MKLKTTIIGLALAAAGLATPPTVLADTATLDVTATVVGTCRVTVGTGTLVFGDLDVSSAADATANSNDIQFWCTRGASYSITDDNGLHETGTQHRLQSDTLATAEYINYSISYTATGTGNGPQNPITLGVGGTILNADYVNAAADTYSDTVTFTITP
jgi:spore coat protein U-like protein